MILRLLEGGEGKRLILGDPKGEGAERKVLVRILESDDAELPRLLLRRLDDEGTGERVIVRAVESDKGLQLKVLILRVDRKDQAPEEPQP